MGFRMSVPYLGLTRKVGESGKHKAYGLPICKEAGYERASASKTLDRTLSNQNSYVGFKSGDELWSYLEERANDYRIQVEGKTKTREKVVRERGLRKDAIVGFAVIFKPPADVISEWDTETRNRFFSDCHEVARELEPELFQESNILMIARHFDEGEDHEHMFGIPLTKDGRYNGSDMLTHMRRNFNENFARCMRERGWDMDDLDLYDKGRAENDEEYRVSRRAKKGKQGLSVNDYADMMEEQRAQETLERSIEAQENMLDALRNQRAAEEQAQQVIDEAESQREEAKSMHKQAEMMLDVAVAARERWEQMPDELAERESAVAERELDAQKRESQLASDESALQSERALFDRLVSSEVETRTKSVIDEANRAKREAIEAKQAYEREREIELRPVVEDVITSLPFEIAEATYKNDWSNRGFERQRKFMNWLSDVWKQYVTPVLDTVVTTLTNRLSYKNQKDLRAHRNKVEQFDLELKQKSAPSKPFDPESFVDDMAARMGPITDAEPIHVDIRDDEQDTRQMSL